MTHRHRLKTYMGGTEKMGNAVALKSNSNATMNSANVILEKKSDWVELSDECHTITQEKDLKWEDTQALIKKARKILNERRS